MTNRFPVVVESVSRRDACAVLRLSGGRLHARAWPGIARGERRAVRIRPEDVILCAEAPGLVSARNVLAGHVRAVAATPDGARIALDVGFPLTALVTRRAREDLSLARGRAVFALVKATAIVPESTVRVRFRLTVVGARGEISAERLDLLRAIDRAGSLTKAAVELGIAYRTAWAWAEGANRAWGAPLVARTKGGRGGGGAALTPDGRAVLEAASHRERAL